MVLRPIIRIVILSLCAAALASLRVLGADGDAARDPEIAGPAWGGKGAWRTRIQQVFDPATRILSRRLYTIWDPDPLRDLDFGWTPDNLAADKAGRIDGRMWKGGSQIQLLPDEVHKNFENFGVFSLVKGQLVPLNLTIEVQNRTS
jgi:hypothetical protein